MCNVLGVSRSTYYAAVGRPISARAKENDELSRRIREIWSRSRQRYGYPKVAEQLRREGVQVSDRRVWRIMSEMGIKSITIKRFKAHGRSQDKAERTNELKQDFYADRPNLKWATDITYIPTHNDGWTYLASVLDLCTRKIIGWSYGKRATAELAVSALELALGNQGYPQGVIVHSDMGSQYTSELYCACIRQNNLIPSFSKKGCPYDNAMIESFHGILKREEVNLRHYKDAKTAKLALFDFIEGWYNRTRLHGSLGNMTPQEAEEKHGHQAQPHP